MFVDPTFLVEEFHRVYGAPILDKPTIPSNLRSILRQDLITEEYKEFMYASESDDLVGIADALADLVYVIYGTALEYGIPLSAVLQEVHRSNMSKLENGVPILREDGKILKGSNYSPPEVAGVLAEKKHNLA